MNWKTHPKNEKYITCTDYPSYVMLVRTWAMSKGYLWQAHKFYGYAATPDEAKLEAEEVLLMQLMD